MEGKRKAEDERGPSKRLRVAVEEMEGAEQGQGT